MPAAAVRVWQSTLLLPDCSPSVAYSGGRIAWREKERVGDRPRSGPMTRWETDSELFPHQLSTHNDAVLLARSPERTVHWQRRTI